MKTIYKKNPSLIMLIPVVFLLFSYMLSAQSAEVAKLKREADLYDVRGYLQGQDVNIDGKLMVSPGSGNVTYSYPVSSFTKDGHPFNVTLNYCGSVGFTAFHQIPDGDLEGGWSKFHQNRPAWILGLNGFALNVISQVGKVTHPDALSYLTSMSHSTLTDANLLWMVDGYDFSNRMRWLRSGVIQDEDEIQLLREDGSVLHLRRRAPDGATDGEDELRYTGMYYAYEANHRGYAVVSYDRESETYNYVSTTLAMHGVVGSEQNSYLPRIVKYYPGDGLEYTFQEWMTPLGKDAYENPSQYTGGMRAGPTVFYLEAIRASNGFGFLYEDNVLLHFTREYHTGAEGEPDQRGRAHIIRFEAHQFSFGYNSLYIVAQDRKLRVRFDKVVSSTSADKNELENHFPSSPDAEGYNRNSYLGLVTWIEDYAGRRTSFDYEEYSRDYTGYHWPAQQAGVHLANWRLSKVTEPLQQYRITYKGNTNETIQSAGSEYNNPAWFLNNLVATVKKYEALPGSTPGYVQTGNPLSTDEYTYYSQQDAPGRLDAIACKKTDHVTGKIRSIYNEYVHTGMYYDTQYGYPVYFTGNPVSIEQADDMMIRTETQYTPVGPGYTFLMKPSRRIVKVGKDENSYVNKSDDAYSYQAGLVRDFGNTDVNNQWGMDIVEMDHFVKRPDNAQILLREQTFYEYLQFEKERVKYKCVDHSNLRSGGKGEGEKTLSGGQQQAATTEDCEYTKFAPPLYGLETEVWIYNGQSRFLGGISHTYEENTYVHADYHAPRGTLLQRQVWGRDQNRTVVTGEYKYWMGNLLREEKNANGAVHRLSYTPNVSELYGPQSCEGHIKNDDNSIETHTFIPRTGSLLYEGPVMQEHEVRGGPTLREWTERTSFDLPAGKIDANGWYSRYSYDNNGHLQTAWLPYDFRGPSSPVPYRRMTRDSLFLETGRVHVVEKENQSQSTLSEEETYHDDEAFALKHMQPDYREAGGGGIKDILHFRDLEDYIIFKVTGDDLIHGALHEVRAVDDMQLKFQIKKVVGRCMQIQLKLHNRWWGDAWPPATFFDQTYTLNCKEINPPPQTAIGGGSSSWTQVDTQVDKESYEYVIDLNSVRDEIISHIQAGEGFWGELHVNTLPGVVEVDNTYGERLSPRLVMKGEFEKYVNLGDFTLGASVYDKDGEGSSRMMAKLDDNLHTSGGAASGTHEASVVDENNEVLGYIGGRYSTVSHDLGADYRVKNTSVQRILQDGTNRTDKTEYAYSGLGLQTKVTDAEGYSTESAYDGWDRVTGITKPELLGYASNTPVSLSYETGSPVDFTPLNGAFNLSDQEFYGYYSVKRTQNELGVVFAQYYDAFDRLRREVAHEVLDMAVIPNAQTNLQTRYNYDEQGRLSTVINPKGDTTHYWYDEFGHVQYKYQPDMGTISYGYDDVGNMRFSQSQQQSRENKMTFREYDDLNRVKVIGEGQFAPYQHSGRGWPNSISSSEVNFNRLSDMAVGSVLHDGGKSNMLTVNKTLTYTAESAVPRFWSIGGLSESWCMPPPNSLMGEESTPPEPPYLRHSAQSWEPVNTLSTLDNFEDISVHPENVRTVVQYDGLPMVAGAVWGGFPLPIQWNALMPGGVVRNPLGHEVAVAYREHSGEAFHYTVMSYDERGRVEAVLHYNENLGFDGVYYRYNSMNLLIEVKVVDPQRQHVSWYGYDNNGRVSSVWTKLGNVGTGLGVSSAAYPVAVLTKPEEADIIYDYTKRDQVGQMKYPVPGVSVEYVYNGRQWLESLSAGSGGGPLFREVLRYSKTGSIMQQLYQHGMSTEQTLHYEGYDELERLNVWNRTSDGYGTEYQYDGVGNRSRERKIAGGSGWTQESKEYEYGGDGGSNHLTAVRWKDATGTEVHESQNDYSGDGAMKERREYGVSGMLMSLQKRESFGYGYNGLLKKYTSGEAGTVLWDWRYRYSGSGEREQKRVYTEQLGVLPAPGGSKSWTYYLLGGDQKQLAVYKGIEAENQCGTTGKYVYLYPSEYLCYGSGGIHNITIRPYDQYNGKKEFAIVDHLGSSRVVINEWGQIKSETDYEPFGEPLSGSTGIGMRKSFIDKEKDKESGDDNFGVRYYSGKHGRFNSIDPLWEAYPSQSPYNYCGNNPLILSDPTGKAGEGALQGPGLIGIGMGLIDFGTNFVEGAHHYLFLLETGRIRQEIYKDGIFGYFDLSRDVEVGKVGSVPDLDEKTIDDVDKTLKGDGWSGGEPTKENPDNPKQGGNRTYKNDEDNSTITVKKNGEIVRTTKSRYDGLTGQRINKGEKLIKTKDGFKATRDQELIHKSRDLEKAKTE